VYKRQKYIGNISPFLGKPVIKVIAGMRRTGKSTILKMLIDHIVSTGVNNEQIIYINMESLSNSHLADISVLYKHINTQKSKTHKKIYLLIDEVQEIENWEKAINSFFADGGIDITITGSNSRLLSGELATLISGRYIEFGVYPLVFSEFSLFRENRTRGTSELFNEFLRFGGMPGIHHLRLNESDVYQYLSAIKDSVVLKDVVKRNNIRDVSLLDKIIQFVFDNMGNIFSSRSVADYIKKERRSMGIETVYNYLYQLEAAFIIIRIPRFDIKGKKLLETNEKFYLMDIGLSHSLFGYRQKNVNDYLENIVLIELLHRGYDVTIGKLDDYEIDFIAQRSGEKIYIQVCYLITDEKVLKRELRSLHKIKDNYPKYLLSMDNVPESSEEGILRKYIPDWLMEK
jgi:uncharacterized protein